MKIWIIDHYSVPVKYYPLARNTNFAKNLIKRGYEVIIFAASTVHNSSINLIDGKEKYIELISDGVKYVLINCHQYSDNGLMRILNMYEFANKLKRVSKLYSEPDAIISTSMTLQACKAGIRLGKRYNCKKVAQITDLWPETIVAYGKASKYNLAVMWLRRIEKWIYMNADKIIFSMEAAYDYILEQKWDDIIPKSKVSYINNGVDLEQFLYNKEHYIIQDSDLSDTSLFKVIYTGSIRMVNNLGIVLDAAKLIKNSNVRILIWGDGDEREYLIKRTEEEKIDNVKFKGKVDKKYIPFITSNADLNLAHYSSTPLLRFGISLNKIFDYCASGKPILADFKSKANPAIVNGAGIELNEQTAESIAEAIDTFASMNEEARNTFGKNAYIVAKKYSFEYLTDKLEKVITN